MWAKTMRLYYPDTGFLTYLTKNRPVAQVFIDNGFSCAYSEATLMDLRSAAGCTQELDYLNNAEAYFLHEIDGRLEGWVDCPHSRFTDQDRLFPDVMGPILNRTVGGGAGEGDRAFFRDLLGKYETLARYLDALTEDLPNGNGKKTFGKFFEMIPKIGEAQSLSAYIDNQDPPARHVLYETFPQTLPETVGGRAIVAIALNLISPAKGIRKETPDAAGRETIDALHIAYGLGCDLFLTYDKATHKKYNLLAEHWRTRGRAYLVERCS
jgi:hypothetical protein